MSDAPSGRSFESDPHVRQVVEQERLRTLALARHARWDRWLHAPYRACYARWLAAYDAAADALAGGRLTPDLTASLREVTECLRQAGRHWRNVFRWNAAAPFGQAHAWDTAPHLLDWGRTLGRYSYEPGPVAPARLAGPIFPGQAPHTSAVLAILRTAVDNPDDLPWHLEFQSGQPEGLASLADWLRLLRDVLLPPPDARSGEEWARGLVIPADADEMAVRITAGDVGLLLASPAGLAGSCSSAGTGHLDGGKFTTVPTRWAAYGWWE